MTDKESLIQAIESAPDDQSIKLIYANLLDETGAAADRGRGRGDLWSG